MSGLSGFFGTQPPEGKKLLPGFVRMCKDLSGFVRICRWRCLHVAVVLPCGTAHLNVQGLYAVNLPNGEYHWVMIWRPKQTVQENQLRKKNKYFFQTGFPSQPCGKTGIHYSITLIHYIDTIPGPDTAFGTLSNWDLIHYFASVFCHFCHLFLFRFHLAKFKCFQQRVQNKNHALWSLSFTILMVTWPPQFDFRPDVWVGRQDSWFLKCGHTHRCHSWVEGGDSKGVAWNRNRSREGKRTINSPDHQEKRGSHLATRSWYSKIGTGRRMAFTLHMSTSRAARGKKFQSEPKPFQVP